ncbi:MAG: hypothetical protein IJQ80_08750 [Clostridia bacterium]|nr:hypothetical protein [Clostridia bacterium]
MKYVTVTLNPATDQSYTLSAPFRTGTLNRASEMSNITFSGKGINISRELLRLGVDSKAVCLIGTGDGETFYNSLLSENLNLFAVKTVGRVRRNVSVIDSEGVIVEVNEPGDEVPLEDVLKVFSMFDRATSAKEEKVVFISGSAPPGFRNDVYKRFVLGARASGAYVVLDADGELLRRGIEGHPDLIKPNEDELCRLTERTFEGDDETVRADVLEACRELFERTGCAVLCTLGAKGSVYAGAEGSYVCPATPARPNKFKGAGDVFLARFVLERKEHEQSVAEAMRRASDGAARYLEA